MEIASWLHKSLAYSRVSMTWSPVGTQSISFWWWYKKQIQVVRYCDVWVVESCSRSPTTMVCTLGGNGGAAGVASLQASGYCHGCHAMLFWHCSFNIFSSLFLACFALSPCFIGETNLLPKAVLGDLLASPFGKCLEQTQVLSTDQTLLAWDLSFLHS